PSSPRGAPLKSSSRHPFVLAALAVLVSARAHGATFQVHSSADQVDAVPGDGECASATGDCTLRAAIEEANAREGDDIVVLPAGTFCLTLPRSGSQDDGGGDLDIRSNVIVRGAGGGARLHDTALTMRGDSSIHGNASAAGSGSDLSEADSDPSTDTKNPPRISSRLRQKPPTTSSW